MDEAEVKLACLRMAHDQGSHGDAALELAKKFYKWVSQPDERRTIS